MTTLQIVLLASNLLLASFAGLAATMAWRSLRRLRLMLAQRSTRSLRQLDAEVLALNASLSSVSTTVKRLAAKTGMQASRARQQAERETELPANFQQLSVEERRAILRERLATGAMRAHNE